MFIPQICVCVCKRIRTHQQCFFVHLHGCILPHHCLLCKALGNKPVQLFIYTPSFCFFVIKICQISDVCLWAVWRTRACVYFVMVLVGSQTCSKKFIQCPCTPEVEVCVLVPFVLCIYVLWSMTYTTPAVHVRDYTWVRICYGKKYQVRPRDVIYSASKCFSDAARGGMWSVLNKTWF